MEALMEDIMLEIDPHKRFYNQVFIGQPSLKMLEDSLQENYSLNGKDHMLLLKCTAPMR
jgi:hypothetical protein